MIKGAKRIIISRTDSIGDVALTLPMVGAVKRLLPESDIIFLGRAYTKSVIGCCRYVDQFADFDQVQNAANNEQTDFLRDLNADVIVHAFPDKQVCRAAKSAGIAHRIATAGRFHTWQTCNHRVAFSRKSSNLHESQLNFNLLRPLGQVGMPNLEQVYQFAGWQVPNLPERLKTHFEPGKRHVIVHPKSKGSAPEWAESQFESLIDLLPGDDFRIFITGTSAEGAMLSPDFGRKSHVVNLCGQMNLEELIAVIGNCYALVAASTGPLHLAGLCGIHAIGLFSPKPPVHPDRWRPIGPNARVLVSNHHPAANEFLNISPRSVAQILADPQ